MFANSKNHIERNKAASRKIMGDTVKLCGINAAPNGKLRTTSQMAMGESGTGTATGCRDLGSFGLFIFYYSSPVRTERGNLSAIYERPLDYEARRKQSNGYNKQF